MILHGRNLIIKAGGVAIAAAKSCDINVQCEEIETASSTTGAWRTAITGRKSWAVTVNQLVTSISAPLSMIGTTVTLEASVGNEGLPINGFVDNVSLWTGTLNEEPMGIYWDNTLHKIVFHTIEHQGGSSYDKYYAQCAGYEAYSNLRAGQTLSYNGMAYSYQNAYSNLQLVSAKISGQANVVEWRATGTVGNLAQGSFRFNGNGELAIVST